MARRQKAKYNQGATGDGNVTRFNNFQDRIKELERRRVQELIARRKQKNDPPVISVVPIDKKKPKRPKKRAKVKVRNLPSIKASTGENLIKEFLTKRGIKFQTEVEFSDCINPETGMCLRFDFHLPTLKMCIEYDGIQHFEPVIQFHRGSIEDAKSALESQRQRDQYKNQYCKDREIKLLRIAYTEQHKIGIILTENLV